MLAGWKARPTQYKEQRSPVSPQETGLRSFQPMPVLNEFRVTLLQFQNMSGRGKKAASLPSESVLGAERFFRAGWRVTE